MAAIEIIKAFENEYNVSYEDNSDFRHFVNGWCAAQKAVEEKIECPHCKSKNTILTHHCNDCVLNWSDDIQENSVYIG
jgi:hypothetical protein